MKIVEQFKLKKKLLGGYKVTYRCPYCRESLSSQEHEIIEEEECPECGGAFKVADSALSMIESLKNQNESKNNVVSVKQPAKTKNDDDYKSLIAGSASSYACNFKNHVPSEHVRKLSTSYNGRAVKATLEILESGEYIIVAGKVGGPLPSGHDTFRWSAFNSRTISGSIGEIISVSIPIRVTDGYWAVAIFNERSDIETSHTTKEIPSPMNISEMALPATICLVTVLLLGTLIIQSLPSSSSSYSSPNNHRSDYSSSYGSSSSDIDASEYSRRLVTDQMIRQGADPVEAEAFTSELYKAQREWERNKK